MFKIDVRMVGLDKVQKALNTMPRVGAKVTKYALDSTGRAIQAAERKEIKRIFPRHVPATTRSLVLDRAGYDSVNELKIRVWLDPQTYSKSWTRTEHYLTTQIMGGQRQLKPFEQRLRKKKGLKNLPTGHLIPAMGAKPNRRGKPFLAGQIKQILSVLQVAEDSARGYSANMTGRSTLRNRKLRDFVVITAPWRVGRKGGLRGKFRLQPGVYERFVPQGASALNSRQRGKLKKGGAWQKGTRKNAIRARGLRPVLVRDYKGGRVAVPRLARFYVLAELTFARTFERRFDQMMRRAIKEAWA